MPKISVLCPTFNHEKYVGYFIQSILNQTFADWELIIVDDCSTDNNIQQIKKYSDSRIHLYISDYNQGIGNSLNYAFSKAKGDYIVICASDDMLEPDYFDYINTTFKKNKSTGVLYSSLNVIDENNTVYAQNLLNPSYNRISLLKELFYNWNVLFSPGLAVRKSIFKNLIPMDISMIQHQDYQWHVLLLAQTDCNIADKAYVNYRFIKRNEKSLGSASYGEYNRLRLEIDRLMDSFLTIKDINMIRDITNSELCDKIPSSCSDYIWASEALKSGSPERRQWGYKVISKMFNDSKCRKALNKSIGMTFGKFLKIANEIDFYADDGYKKRCRNTKINEAKSAVKRVLKSVLKRGK